MSNRSSNEGPIALAVIVFFVALALWAFVKSVASAIGADPMETGKMMLVGTLAFVALGFTAYFTPVSWRSALLAWLGILWVSARNVLITIANDGRSMADLQGNFSFSVSETWYSSPYFFGVIFALLIAGIVWSIWDDFNNH